MMFIMTGTGLWTTTHLEMLLLPQGSTLNWVVLRSHYSLLTTNILLTENTAKCKVPSNPTIKTFLCEATDESQHVNFLNTHLWIWKDILLKLRYIRQNSVPNSLMILWLLIFMIKPFKLLTILHLKFNGLISRIENII